MTADLSRMAVHGLRCAAEEAYSNNENDSLHALANDLENGVLSIGEVCMSKAEADSLESWCKRAEAAEARAERLLAALRGVASALDIEPQSYYEEKPHKSHEAVYACHLALPIARAAIEAESKERAA